MPDKKLIKSRSSVAIGMMFGAMVGASYGQWSLGMFVGAALGASWDEAKRRGWVKRAE